jgi:hypothetical protein
MSRTIVEKLAELQGLDLPSLRTRWVEAFGNPPSKHIRRDLLLRALAYQVQVRAFGGLRPATLRRLARAAEEIRAGKPPSAHAAAIKPGTRLIREWQGVTHEVIVLETGVQYQGKTWASLSAVAREITGTRWSGPLFFGLKGRSNERR